MTDETRVTALENRCGILETLYASLASDVMLGYPPTAMTHIAAVVGELCRVAGVPTVHAVEWLDALKTQPPDIAAISTATGHLLTALALSATNPQGSA